MIYFANYQFSEPVSLTEWKTDERNGIYAVLIKDPKTKSQPYTAIDFGESDNLSDSSFLMSHQRFDFWIQEAGSEADLYIATFHMPDSASELRQSIVAFLVKYYHPVCNT
ncbi:hypothetical protein ACFLT2_04265 [Acidobacteriota bacterium]